MYAEVVVNRPTYLRPPAGSDPLRGDDASEHTFTYRIPERLRGALAVGHLVQVPIQASTALGVVVALADSAPADLPPESVRDVAELLDPLPVVTPVQIDLACWLAAEYLAPLTQAMRLMLPPGLEERTFVAARHTAAAAAASLPSQRGGLRGGASLPGAIEGLSLTSDQRRVLERLRRATAPVRLSALIAQLRADDGEAVVQSLHDLGLVEARYALIPPRPAPVRVQYVSLLADERTLRAALPRLGQPSKRADVLLALARQMDAPLSLADLCERAGCGHEPVKALEERGWVEITAPRTLIVPLAGPRQPPRGERLSPKQAAAWEELRSGPLPADQGEFLRRAGVAPGVLAALEAKGWVRRVHEPSLVLLKLPPDQVLDRVLELRAGEAERAVLDALRGSSGRVWVGGLYAQTGADLSVLRRLAARGLISLHAEAHDRPPAAPGGAPHRLTPDQERVWQQVERGLPFTSPPSQRGGLRGGAFFPGATGDLPTVERGDEPWVGLLHGVTGSGKTEIYLHAIQRVLDAGRQALALVPEISLTAPTLRRFEARFPGRVAVLHSQLSLGQRYEVWERLRRGDASVLVGPRSALFAPLSRLGLVVVDEAHDASYKQDEPIPLPAYHACDVAIALGRIAGAAVLLGTATPDVATYYRAAQGRTHLLELPQRILSPVAAVGPGPAPDPRSVPAGAASLPPVRVVDLRQELREGNRSIFSRVLQQALRQTLDAGEQAILFLNRRGSATFVLCRDCGHVARCPRCDIPFTYHHALLRHSRESGNPSPAPQGPPLLRHSRESGNPSPAPQGLVCHRCNYRAPAPSECPACGGRHIRFFGLGTERVEAELGELFPQARTLRWDRDTAAGPDHERYLQAFLEHQADVLVGTQMIAKGLHLPLVTLVGVVSADTALDLPDYRSAERAFQLLTQVAGRAGRSRRGGQVIVQTYHPEHYAIRAAARHDFAAFYRQELAYRRALGYPPFGRLVALRFSAPDARLCQAEAERLVRWLASEVRRLELPAELIGPAPCFFARIQGRFRWQIVVRAPDPMPLLRGVALPWGWRVDVDPVTLL